MQAYFSRKRGGASFSLLTLSVWRRGSRGNFLSALKKFSARKGVNNYKENWKVVASKKQL